MAEIKSTLELAMERTKEIRISKAEREEIKQKESLKKANGLFHRYREGYLSLNEILREIERMDAKASPMVRESLLSQWIDALSLNEEDERFLKGIEALKERDINEVKQKFNHLLSRYQTEKGKIIEEVRVHLTEALRKDNIYGSAVEPKIEGSQPLVNQLERLAQAYDVKLKEIKEHLRSL